MKKVAIFYRDRKNSHAISYIENNLYSVFKDYITVENYYLNELQKGEIVKADAYLVLYENMLYYLTNHIKEFSKVIIIQRSIQKSRLKEILSIPTGSDVLVINDSKESTLQTVYMIYELGISHLNLLPYDDNLYKQGAYSHIQTAIITYGLEPLVPPHIKNIVNIQNREIRFDTFIRLMDILDLDHPIIRRNLIRKVHNDVEPNINIKNSYLENYLKEQMLNRVVDNSLSAVILLDKNFKLVYYNEKAYSLFRIELKSDFKQMRILPDNLLLGPDFKNELVSIRNENYLVEKTTIMLIDEIIGYCITLQNEKNLRDAEIILSNKLKNRGLYARYTFDDIIHESDSMKKCIEIAKKVSLSDDTILIRGESGTGKELLAQSIHNYSGRKNGPFVAVNCAALPESLLESELFGYERGAFTGARKDGKIGLFEQAHHGTIFLDEIGDIPPKLQARLLRVIQERQIMRIGSDKVINIDVRIIAATNKNLEKQMMEGNFRSDLFYRLNVIEIFIEPLRKRRKDILPLLKSFLGKLYDTITEKDKQMLLNYNWPGNIRELKNVASYFKLLGFFPAYIYNHNSIVLNNNGTYNIAPYDDTAIQMLILKIIKDATQSFNGIGRTTIHMKLSELNIHIGEGRLRRIIKYLESQGLIKVNNGRTGTQITEKGLEVLKKKEMLEL
ncbi:MAG TPA: sigma 54-interacting transcriptional regulator [Tissierellia bacterium]|nr:sigma 54-interacting transcriptional regulator [Tissierellia bacterium]